ncbi:hypothetical protein NP493_420g01025 [Ridgeia piscesae]|uniref:Uncharacterized protein n=1 Tax=Ridgeia piscesae TaxID=27915 RepID=A0AAD9L1X7_RIDPI|nr:hypothetical protein NP493_420g01025 [Ridgeia piscesae]
MTSLRNNYRTDRPSCHVIVTEKSPHKKAERHTDCLDSTTPVYKPKHNVGLQWKNLTMRPPWTPTRGRRTDATLCGIAKQFCILRYHVSCGVPQNPDAAWMKDQRDKSPPRPILRAWHSRPPLSLKFGGKSEVFRSGHRTPSGKRAQTPASKGDGEPAAGDAARTEKATPPPVEGTLTDQQVAEKKEDARRRPKTSRRCVSARTTRQGRPKSSVNQRTTGPVRLGSQTPRKRPKTGRGRQGEMEATPKARGVVEVESGAKSQTLQFLAEAMDGVYDADSGDSNGATPGDSADATRRRDNEDIAKETGRSSGDDQENTHKVRPIVTRQESSTQTTATEDAGMKPKPKPVTSSTASQAGDGIPIDVVVTVEDTPPVRSDGTASVEGENDVEALAVDPGKDSPLEDLFGEKKKDDDVSAMARERDKNSQTMVILAGGVTEVTESRTEITADDETREIIDGSGRIPEHDTTQAEDKPPVEGHGESASLLNQENAVIQEHPAANAGEENTSGGNEEANVATSPQHDGEPVTNETGSEGKGQSDNSSRESGSSYSGSESETGSDRSSASSRQSESNIQPVPRLQDKTGGVERQRRLRFDRILRCCHFDRSDSGGHGEAKRRRRRSLARDNVVYWQPIE